MSVFIGVVLGFLLYWYAKDKPGLGIIGSSVHVQTEKAVVSKPVTVQPEAQKKSKIETKSTAAPKKKSSRTAKKSSVFTSGQKRSSRQTKKDDLKKIGGIGPKIAEILNNDGVITFKQLSNKKPTELKNILDKAGSRYRDSDLSTWSKQAKFAEKGDWKAAKAVWNTL